jgi:hypothetical protein
MPTQSECESDLIVLCSTVKTNILYLSSQQLFKIQITASHDRIWKYALLIAPMIAASKSTFIIFGDQKEHQLFS